MAQTPSRDASASALRAAGEPPGILRLENPVGQIEHALKELIGGRVEGRAAPPDLYQWMGEIRDRLLSVDGSREPQRAERLRHSLVSILNRFLDAPGAADRSPLTLSSVLFQLPVALGKDLRTAYLLVDRRSDGRHAADEHRPLRFILVVTLPRLGTVRARVELQREEIAVELAADRRSTVALLAERRPELKDLLEQLGLRVRTVTARHEGERRLRSIPGPDGIELLDLWV